MAKTENPDDLFSEYDAVDYKKTTLLTLKKWVDATKRDPNKVPREKRLLPTQTIKVGASRTMDMFTRSALDAWTPGTRNPEAAIEKAAALLGISVEDAKALRNGQARVTK